MKFKLSKVDDLRTQVLNDVDAVYARKYQELLGPFSYVHSLKAQGHLILDGEDGVASNVKQQEQLEAIGKLEKERIELKRRIRAATSTEELNGIRCPK